MRHTSSVQSQLSREWSTAGGLIAVAWVFAAATLVWLALADSAADRLFIGVLALVLTGLASCGGIMRPRLAADAEGVTVRGLRGARHWPWSGVTVRIQEANRLGRTVETLELDVPGDELIILGRLDLGEDPREVAETLATLRT